jgi:hypothetical protein
MHPMLDRSLKIVKRMAGDLLAGPIALGNLERRAASQRLIKQR